VKALGIIGYHHTGKTTLATFIISRLWEMGFKVNSIKDIHNEAYRADAEGTNSWKHAKAGSSRVLAIGTKDAALVITPQPDLKSALPLFDCDWLIVEGLKDAALPRIVCATSEDQLAELVDDRCIGISGPVAESISHYRGLPCFCLQRDAGTLMDTVLAKTFKILPQSDPECCSVCGSDCNTMAGNIVQGKAGRSDCVLDASAKIQLFVNDRPVTIVPFVQNIIQDTVRALVGNLKDIDPDGAVRLEIKGRD
jgi:molybdopterin-guanine dinucleotide biosynthesis protein B